MLVIWEFYEIFVDTISYNIDFTTNRNMQRWQWINGSATSPQDYGLYDTMTDLWVGALGALVVVIVGYFLIKNKQTT